MFFFAVSKSIVDWDVVRISFSALDEIGRWVEAGKRLKVVDEMRLVVVTAGQRDVHPINTLLFPEAAQNLLKASDAAELLGRQSDFVAKHLNEVPLTEADLIGHA